MPIHPNRNKVLFFAAAVALLNLLQSCFTQLTGDEALYWLYSRNMDWGFKDHPPVIGLFTGAGYFLFKNELGVRLLTVVSSMVVAVVVHRLANPKSILAFALIYLSIPILHVYGFITTPDVPLLLFSSIYLLVWKKFLDTQSFNNTMLLGILMAALVWSKYHGIFVILFTWLPLRKFWFNKNFWMAALFGIMLFSPHILWQALHDLPTLKFHVVDRAGDFEWDHLSKYIAGQFMVFNPVILVLGCFVLFRFKTKENFETSLRWLFVLLLFVFMIASVRGRVEPHWTAVAAIPLTVLCVQYFNHQQNTRVLKWSLATIAFAIVVLRAGLVADFLPFHIREFHSNRQKMHDLQKVAGALPVCFMNSYQNPSLYMFYNHHAAHSITNTGGGGAFNQFDFWHYNDSINSKPFAMISGDAFEGFEKVEMRGSRNFWFRKFDDLQVFHQCRIKTDAWLHHAKPNEPVNISATIKNMNNYSLYFNDSLHTLFWKGYMNAKEKNERIFPVEISGLPTQLAAGSSARILISFTVPELEGSHRMRIAAAWDKLPYTYQSNWIRLVIE